jgi:hypothetical protein
VGTDRDVGDLPPEEEYPEPSDEASGSALPAKAESWRKRSATGAILTGFAFGLREVLEPERHEPAIVLETSGTPPKDLPVEADLETPAPRRSVVKVRPWLLGEGERGALADGTSDEVVDDTAGVEDRAAGNRTPTPARRLRRRR